MPQATSQFGPHRSLAQAAPAIVPDVQQSLFAAPADGPAAGPGTRWETVEHTSLSWGKLVVMPVTLHVPEDLASRLAAEASRRGVSVDELSAQLLAAGLPEEDPLEAFIGSGDSGDPTWASRDIHELRSELATRHTGEHA